jgi:aldose 1-epimerase
MSFAIRTRQQPELAGPDQTVIVLEEVAGGGCAEICPALGFNCYRWQVRSGEETAEILYADPNFFREGRPTRSGIPILFPFPNRIRGGRFTWDGKEYQLPANDPARQNAIHGFACRRPWRVVDQSAGAESAWVTAEFHCKQDASDCLALWPADHAIRITCRLGRGILRLEAEVRNPDSVPLPFGLGYHPYFRMPFQTSRSVNECTVTVPASEYWVLEANLPGGERRPVDASRDLNQPRRFADLNLDDVLTALPARPPRRDGLYERATLEGGGRTPLRLFCSGEFREMVVFTPPHRQAFCVEPYTCTTDAINLQQRGVDAGWLVLPPGGVWRSTVELWV